MANTYTLITSTTVGSGGASAITFSSIPQTYTDLLVRISGREATQSAWAGFIYFNNSNSSLTQKNIYGSGSGVFTSSRSDGLITLNAASATANVFSNTEIYIPNYTSSNNKSFSHDGTSETNGTTAYALLGALLWSNTSAINRIDIIGYSGDLAQYSTAYLYGIKNS